MSNKTWYALASLIMVFSLLLGACSPQATATEPPSTEPPATSDPDARNADVYRDVPPGEPPSLVNPPKGCRFHPRCSQMIEDLCNVEIPSEFEPTPAHYASCWLYK